MIKIALYDNSRFYLKRIRNLIEEYMNGENGYIIKEYKHPINFAKTLVNREEEFDVFILGIDSLVLDGFDFADYIHRELMNDEYNPLIIFVSKYEMKACEAIKHKVFRYIRKNRLENDMKEAICAFLEEFNSRKYREKDCDILAIDSEFDYSDIMCYEKADRDIRVTKSNGKTYNIKRKSMKKIMEEMTNKELDFAMVHCGAIVNMAFIKEYDGNRVVLENKEIYLSRRHKKEFGQCFSKYMKSISGKRRQ